MNLQLSFTAPLSFSSPPIAQNDVSAPREFATAPRGDPVHFENLWPTASAY